MRRPGIEALALTISYTMQSSCRYLREEALEVQVWATVLARPKAEDTLLGFAYIPLGEILSDKNEVYVR